MSTQFQTANKQSLKQLTSHKSDFSFSFNSPKQNLQSTLPKQPFMQNSRIDNLRNRMQLFPQTSQKQSKQYKQSKQTKQNIELISMLNKSYPKQFVQQIKTEQRLQIQKLLLQISRLHDLLEDQQRIHRHTVQRLKQQSQQITLLHISNIKQSQYTQLQAIQLQLKKTRQNLDDRNQQYELLEKNTSRIIQNLAKQNQKLKYDLREFVQKKNLQLYEMKNQLDRSSLQITNNKNKQIQEMKQLADRQLRKLYKKIEQKQSQLQILTKSKDKAIKQKSHLQQLLDQQKHHLQIKIQHIIDQQFHKQQTIKNNLKQFYSLQAQSSQNSINLQRQLYMRQIQQLMQVINIKNNQIKRSLIFRETQKIDFQLQIKSLESQNQYIKKFVKSQKIYHMEEIQGLKVKMGVLHQSDIQSLVALYQAKIQALTKDLQYMQVQSDKLLKQSKKQRQTLYQIKKKYDYTVSFLNQQILQLRAGASSTERDMKDRLQNQKSMMMITSRNFIKQNQLKNNNIRFYEQQLRKLRQLLQIQAQQVQQSQRNVQQKIKLAQDQLGRLSNKIIEVKSQAEQSQKKLKLIIQQKNTQIKRLNQLMNNSKIIKKDDENLRGEIRKLDQQIVKKQDQLRTLKYRNQQLQSQMRLVKSQNQKLQIQAQINSEDAKKKYKTLSDKNLVDMKNFYDRRLQELEHDKRQLNKITSSQYEQITELIKRYKQLQQNMRVLIQQSKKRSQLQSKIIQLGMDNNLVKNMVELFHK